MEPSLELFRSFAESLVIASGLIRHEERVHSDDARVATSAGDGSSASHSPFGASETP